MEKLYLNIMEQVRNTLPELSLIDEDYGQLDTEEDTYPVTFPCVLIGNANIEWLTTKSLCQKGNAEITIRLAIDCYDDTHAGSGTETYIVERQRMAARLNECLHAFKPAENTSILMRTKSTQYAVRGGIKIYETIYTFSIHEGRHT